MRCASDWPWRCLSSAPSVTALSLVDDPINYPLPSQTSKRAFNSWKRPWRSRKSVLPFGRYARCRRCVSAGRPCFSARPWRPTCPRVGRGAHTKPLWSSDHAFITRWDAIIESQPMLLSLLGVAATATAAASGMDVDEAAPVKSAAVELDVYFRLLVTIVLLDQKQVEKVVVLSPCCWKMHISIILLTPAPFPSGSRIRAVDGESHSGSEPAHT